MKNLQIRAETKADEKAIFKLNVAAFESDAEAKLIDKLRADASPFISLVAELDGEIVGHIMFTPVTMVRKFAGVTIKSAVKNKKLKMMGLAPLCVLPEQQNEGIGTALVEAGFEACKAIDYTASVVLGNPFYYKRFGFVPTAEFNIDSEFRIPKELFMAVEFVPKALRWRAGRVLYHQAFAELNTNINITS